MYVVVFDDEDRLLPTGDRAGAGLRLSYWKIDTRCHSISKEMSYTWNIMCHVNYQVYYDVFISTINITITFTATTTTTTNNNNNNGIHNKDNTCHYLI